jgi:uncharacterized membrane protein
VTDDRPAAPPADETTVRDRWLSALCYVPLLVLLTMLSGERSAFLSRHARQGFALLLVEVVGVAFILIIDASLGQLPFIGFLLVILLRLVFFLGVLIISVLGFTRALFGEMWQIPHLDELAERVPIH